MQVSDRGDAVGADGPAPASDAARLQAALEALTARDQVLAARTRRLAALEDTAARLAVTAARLQAAEEELAALRREHQAGLAERDLRLAQLEALLGASPPAGKSPPGPLEAAPSSLHADATDAVRRRLEADLKAERQRNFRLQQRGSGGPSHEAGRLQEAPDSTRPEIAAPEPRPAERTGGELPRAEETIRHQRAVLEEKERLIGVLIERLRRRGAVHEGPDDLKQIVGIGPVIEDLLHGLGITTFEQLAALSAADEEQIGELLGNFRERIERDRWVEQAAELARRRVRLSPGLSLG
ncbi:MAG: hypothetical protein FJW79_03900 [Actinobacteria bacterium]|nr:hypothetical protein [Actinomycetota bacterium]